MAGLADRKPLVFSLLLSALVLAMTADERVFGLITDGQIMTRTAYSIVEFGELGIAKGHPVDIPRPEGDAVTRYGMGPSLVRILPVWLAGSFEAALGTGSSQTLFVLEQLLLVLAAAGAAGALARAWGAPASGQRRAVLACALASPLWAYAGSDFSEPLQAAALGGTFAFAALSRGEAGGEKRAALCSALAGACAGAALLSKSIFIVLLPVALLVVAGGVPRTSRVPRALACVAGWAPLAGLWLAFEIARFGRPFASYAGEHFNHPPLDGLWRLTVGPNKGLLLYFPLALLAVPAWKRLFPRDRAEGAATLGFTAFLLLATAAWWSWDGAAGWGPRLLVPLVPLLAALAGFASVSLPAAVFRAAFGLGMAVNAIGVLQPDAVTTWYYFILPKRPLAEAEVARWPSFAYQRAPNGQAELLSLHEVQNHADLSPIRVSAWLLKTRLLGGDVLGSLGSPPWRTDRPDRRVAVAPREAIPDSALVFLTSSFRWPRLGMSLTRRGDQLDTVLSYVDCLYDQALRAQDMRNGERAILFGEELWRRVPGPQSATALAEGYRIAGRKETLAEFLRSVPAAWRGSPEWGIVVALWFRDRGEDEKAVRTLGRVVEIAPRPELRRLLPLPPREWPATLREIQLAELSTRRSP
jgi:hypothetical protein